jgi:hypothetical protein
MEGYCKALPRPTNKTIPCLGYSIKTMGKKIKKLDYQRGNAYGKEYSMNMHYLSQGIPKIHWAP